MAQAQKYNKKITPILYLQKDDRIVNSASLQY